MALYTIDLMGNDDIVMISDKENHEEIARYDEMRRRVLEEIFRRSPQLQLVEVQNEC